MSDLSGPTEFGPVRGRVMGSRLGGAFIVVVGALIALVPLLARGAGVGIFVFLAMIGLGLASLGAWLLYFASNLAHLRVTMRPEGLDVIGLAGTRIWPYQRMPRRHALVPWSEIKGLVLTTTPNPMVAGGEERRYVLYSSQGDFHFNSLHWRDVDDLALQISRRSGRQVGDVAPERQQDVARLEASVKRGHRFLRACGWVSLVTAGLFALAAVALLAQRDFATAGKIAMMVAILVGIGGLLVRKTP